MGLNKLFMSSNHIAPQGGRFEPQRSNNVLLFVENMEPFGLSAISGDNLLTLALESFPLPKQRNDPIELGYLNNQVKVAGQAMTDEMEVVFRDFVDVGVARVLQNWRASVYDPQSGRIGRAARYKRRAEVHLIPPEGAAFGAGVRKYIVEGMWPSMMDPGDADMTSAEVLKINCTFQFDRVYPSDSTGWGGKLLRVLSQVS